MFNNLYFLGERSLIQPHLHLKNTQVIEFKLTIQHHQAQEDFCKILQIYSTDLFFRLKRELMDLNLNSLSSKEINIGDN